MIEDIKKFVPTLTLLFLITILVPFEVLYYFFEINRPEELGRSIFAAIILGVAFSIAGFIFVLAILDVSKKIYYFLGSICLIILLQIIFVQYYWDRDITEFIVNMRIYLIEYSVGFLVGLFVVNFLPIIFKPSLMPTFLYVFLFCLLIIILTVFVVIIVQKYTEFSSLENRLVRCGYFYDHFCFRRVFNTYNNQMQPELCNKNKAASICLGALGIAQKDIRLCYETSDFIDTRYYCIKEILAKSENKLKTCESISDLRGRRLCIDDLVRLTPYSESRENFEERLSLCDELEKIEKQIGGGYSEYCYRDIAPEAVKLFSLERALSICDKAQNFFSQCFSSIMDENKDKEICHCVSKSDNSSDEVIRYFCSERAKLVLPSEGKFHCE